MSEDKTIDPKSTSPSALGSSLDAGIDFKYDLKHKKGLAHRDPGTFTAAKSQIAANIIGGT